MSRNPESLIVNNILKELRSTGGVWFKIHGGAYQETGIPDIIGCREGQFIGIEVKTTTGKVSKRQELIISKIQKAGGKAGVAKNIKEAYDICGNSE